MAPNEVTEAALAAVNPTDLVRYARSTGWIRHDRVPPPLAVFSYPGWEEADLLVPLEPTYRDYARRVLDAVETLAERAGCSAADVLAEVPSGLSDVVRFKAESGSSAFAGAPVPEAVNLITGVRKALVAASCDVSSPSRFHPRLAASDSFVDACLLSTEPGSLVVRVLCPMRAAAPGEAGQPRLPTATPFAREVTMHLMTAAAQVGQAILDQQPDRVTSGDGLVPSANLLEAFVQLQPPEDRSLLTLSCRWSPGLGAPNDVPRQTVLRGEYRPHIENLAARLRPARGAIGEALFVGKVVDVSRGADSAGGDAGQVTMAALVDEEVLRIAFTLEGDDFRSACDALRDDLLVRVRGTLHRRTRLHLLESPRRFLPLGEEEEL
jgi:hypothetical protein